MLKLGGAAHACKTQQCVIVLLLFAIPAAVQFSRYADSRTRGQWVCPPPAVYELCGNVARPGIYRFTDTHHTVTLAEVCGAFTTPASSKHARLPGGTRVVFAGSGPVFRSMDAPALISYGMRISLATATAEDLELIPGIGPHTARMLINYRTCTTVRCLDQLLDIKGIGPKKLKKITRHLKP